MRLLRRTLLAALLGGAPAAALLLPTDAGASVSIAVAFDALVRDADAVGIVSPTEAKSVWEDGRIYTYTHVKVEQGVAGELGTGADGWVRTLGGVVASIGQLVDGEPVFTTGKSSLVFLRRFKSTGTWEVSARAQGQYPVVLSGTDDTPASRTRKVVRSSAVGMILPPRTAIAATAAEDSRPAAAAGGPTKSVETGAADAVKVRLAGDVLHDRALDDATREVAAAWKRLHPVASSNDNK